MHFFVKDHLGSSAALTGIYGEALERGEYLPFGASRWGSGAEVTRYRFTDQERDLHTGFYNYDARLYDPALGRFASPDSMLPDPYDPQRLNRYAYCRNNPLIYIDPTGHWDVEGRSDGGFGGHGIGNPGSYGGRDSVGAPGFGDGSPLGDDRMSVSNSRTRSLGARAGYDRALSVMADIGSTAYSYDSFFSAQFGMNTWKCNKYVADKILASGVPMPSRTAYADTLWGRLKELLGVHSPFAAGEWAAGTVSGWTTVDKPMVGDIVATPPKPGQRSGHCGVYVGDGKTVSAGEHSININDFGFRAGERATFNRSEY